MNKNVLILSCSTWCWKLMSGTNCFLSLSFVALYKRNMHYCSLHMHPSTTHRDAHKHTSSTIQPLWKQLQHLSLPTTTTVPKTLKQEETSPATIWQHICLTFGSKAMKEKRHKWEWCLPAQRQIYCPLVPSESQSTAHSQGDHLHSLYVKILASLYATSYQNTVMLIGLRLLDERTHRNSRHILFKYSLQGLILIHSDRFLCIDTGFVS